MDQSWWFCNGDMVVDIVVFLALAAALIWISKLIHDTRQARRDRRAAAIIYQQNADDERINRSNVG